MTMRLIALSVFTVLCLQRAAAEDLLGQVGIYYSFEQPPSPAVFSQLQTEFQRVLLPTRLPVQWRKVGAAKAEEFRDIFIIHFHGSCSMETQPGDERGLSSDQRSLGATQMSNGQILPFADIKCDSLRRFLKVSSEADATGSEVFGRALARVALHELYHMVTASGFHGGTGIGRAEYSRANLTGPRLVFGKNESERLRSWAATERPANTPATGQ